MKGANGLAHHQKIALIFVIIAVALAVSLVVVPPEAPPEGVEVTPVVFEELDEMFIDIDASGDASCQLVMQLLPSELADSMKTAISLLGTEIMEPNYIESVRGSFGKCGLEVRGPECEITGFGTEDNFKIALTWNVPKIARWEENSWTIVSEWVDVQSAADETIAELRSSWILIRNIAKEHNIQYARYKISYRSTWILPENAENIYCPLFDSLQVIEYGGGTYSKASLYSENIDGRPAVVENSLTLIVAENEITITPQQLIENYLSYTVSYDGAPPKDVSFVDSEEQVRLDLKYGRELGEQYSIYCRGSWYSLSPAQVLYYAAEAIDNYNQGVQFSIHQPLSVAPPSSENGDLGAFWRVLSKTEYLSIARQVHDNISSTAVAPGVITTPHGRIRFKDALLTFVRILSYYEENGALPSEIMLTPSPSGQLFWDNVEVPANYAYFLLSDIYVITNSYRDNQVLDNIYQPGYDNRAFANGICDWAHTNIDYTLIVIPPTSEWTLEYKQGQCRDYANVNLALFRTAGIPAKRMGGWIILTGEWQPPTGLAPFMKGETPDGETIGSHAWTQVYLPGEGWTFADSTWGYFENVPYPIYQQREQTWVDALAGYETEYGLI